MAPEAATLDVRKITPRERHPLIFQSFEDLTPGQGFTLVNDHDPKPLYYQFMAEHPGQAARIRAGSLAGPDHKARKLEPAADVPQPLLARGRSARICARRSSSLIHDWPEPVRIRGEPIQNRDEFIRVFDNLDLIRGSKPGSASLWCRAAIRGGLHLQLMAVR
jgi:hypothetical protein